MFSSHGSPNIQTESSGLINALKLPSSGSKSGLLEKDRCIEPPAGSKSSFVFRFVTSFGTGISTFNKTVATEDQRRARLSALIQLKRQQRDKNLRRGEGQGDTNKTNETTACTSYSMKTFDNTRGGAWHAEETADGHHRMTHAV